MTNVKEACDHPVVAYWHEKWTDADLELFQVTRGDSAGQARLEAFTLHLSILTWRRVLAEAEGGLIVVSDALGVLHDALKLKAKDATLNALFADTALILAPMGLQIGGAHLWSQRNVVCDALSRIDGTSNLPEPLRAAMKTRVKRPQFHILNARE